MSGVSTFNDELKGRNVVIWSDNSGAEHATRKGLPHFLLFFVTTSYHFIGTAKRFDQGCLIHVLWKWFLEKQIGVWIERVPTKENIADNPSRCLCS